MHDIVEEFYRFAVNMLFSQSCGYCKKSPKIESTHQISLFEFIFFGTFPHKPGRKTLLIQ